MYRTVLVDTIMQNHSQEIRLPCRKSQHTRLHAYVWMNFKANCTLQLCCSSTVYVQSGRQLKEQEVTLEGPHSDGEMLTTSQVAQLASGNTRSCCSTVQPCPKSKTTCWLIFSNFNSANLTYSYYWLSHWLSSIISLSISWIWIVLS